MSGEVVHAKRDFYGVHKVLRVGGPVFQGLDTAGRRTSYGASFHVLYDGTTRHGAEALEPRLRGKPTSYYHPTGPVGRIFSGFEGTGRFDRIAVVGLGAGSLAAYAPEGGRITFYEIAPEIGRIPADERLFTFLRDSRARVELKIGDGRLELAREPPCLDLRGTGGRKVLLPLNLHHAETTALAVLLGLAFSIIRSPWKMTLAAGLPLAGGKSG